MNPIKEFIQSWKDTRKKLNKKKKKKELKKLKKKKTISEHIDKELDRQVKQLKSKKEEIYNEYRQNLIENNELIEIGKGREIKLDKIDKLPKKIIKRFESLLSGKKYSNTHKGLYLGYGNQVKFIDIQTPKAKTYSTEDNEQYMLNTNDDDPWYIDGKRLVWIHHDTIFNPEMKIDKDKKFIFDISPRKFWNDLNNIFDYNYTKPSKSSFLGEGMNWKKILLGLAIFGAIAYAYSQNQENAKEILIPALSMIGIRRKRYHDK